jgi:hypothetical protein
LSELVKELFCLPATLSAATSRYFKRNAIMNIHGGCLCKAIRYESTDEPAMTIWTASAPRWACIAESLPRVERQPPPLA